MPARSGSGGIGTRLRRGAFARAGALNIGRAESHRRRRWFAPPPDDLSQSLARHGMPPTLVGFVRRVSAWSQFRIAILAIAIFTLNTAPLEMQRRIFNAALHDRDVGLVVGLAAVYAAIVLCEGLLKLLLNVYGGWIGEKAVRVLRLAASKLVDSLPTSQRGPGARGVELSMILAEPAPIGG